MPLHGQNHELPTISHHPREDLVADVGRARSKDDLGHTVVAADETVRGRFVILSVLDAEIVIGRKLFDSITRTADHQNSSSAHRGICQGLPTVVQDADQMHVLIRAHIDGVAIQTEHGRSCPYGQPG